jgi:polar amino acid transport system substrate-binding protein
VLARLWRRQRQFREGRDVERRAAAASGEEAKGLRRRRHRRCWKVCESGKLTVSTDPAYPPQSSLNEQTGEYEGFDIDVATEIAKRLGVDVAWETPRWDVITAGSWNGRWDTTVGSMTPTNDRQRSSTSPSPTTTRPAVVVVLADDESVTDLTTDLDGKKIGVCSGCTYEQFLNKELDIDGYDFDFVVDDAEVSATTRTRPPRGPRERPRRRGDHRGDHRPGLHRRGQPGEDRGRPDLLRAALGGLRQSSDPPRSRCTRQVDAIVAEITRTAR